MLMISTSQKSDDEISRQTSSDQEDCIKENCDCHPKTINVISQEQELVLDILRKVEDEKVKQELFEVLQKSVNKPKIKKTVSPYNSNEILKIFNQKSPNDLTIKDLWEEIRQYKKEIKDLRQFTSLGFINIQEQINRIIINQRNLDDNQENLEEVLESSQANDEATDAYLNTVSMVIFRRWEVSLTIVIKDRFVLNIVTLIDLGSTLNCMQEGLAPTQFYEKTKQILSKGNGKRLTIKYKLSNAHICNQGICVKQTFILVRDLKEKALLGVPFLNSIYPIKVDDQGLRTTLLDKEI